MMAKYAALALACAYTASTARAAECPTTATLFTVMPDCVAELLPMQAQITELQASGGLDNPPPSLVEPLCAGACPKYFMTYDVCPDALLEQARKLIVSQCVTTQTPSEPAATTTTTEPTGPAVLAIKDIQAHGADGASNMVGQTVKIVGSLTGNFGPKNPGKWVFVQDSMELYSGMFVHDVDMGTLQLGQCVSVTGKVDEYRDVTQLQNGVVEASADCSSPVPPITVNPSVFATMESGEPYESLLVKIVNVEVVDENPDKTDPDPAKSKNYGAMTVKDSAGKEVVVDNEVYGDNVMGGRDKYPVGTKYDSIVGVVTWHYGVWKIYVRDASDVVAAAGAPAQARQCTDPLGFVGYGCLPVALDSAMNAPGAFDTTAGIATFCNDECVNRMNNIDQCESPDDVFASLGASGPGMRSLFDITQTVCVKFESETTGANCYGEMFALMPAFGNLQTVPTCAFFAENGLSMDCMKTLIDKKYEETTLNGEVLFPPSVTGVITPAYNLCSADSNADLSSIFGGAPAPAPTPPGASVTPPEIVAKTGHVVKGEITLAGVTKDAFDAAKFSAGFAAAFDAPASAVQVLGVTEVSRRHLLAAGLKVDFQIVASSAEDAKGIEESVKTESPERIATSLKGAGLPVTTIAIANLAATDLDATTTTTTTTTTTAAAAATTAAPKTPSTPAAATTAATTPASSAASVGVFATAVAVAAAAMA